MEIWNTFAGHFLARDCGTTMASTESSCLAKYLVGQCPEDTLLTAAGTTTPEAGAEQSRLLLFKHTTTVVKSKKMIYATCMVATWNIQTLHQAGKMASVASKMKS